VIPPRCLIIQGHLGRFVDGALEGPRARTMREHLEVCARCLEAERMARAIPVMLASSLYPPPPPTLRPRLLATLRQRRRRERRTAAAMAGALVLLLVGAAVAGARSIHHPAPTSSQSAASRAVVVPSDPSSLASGRPATATLGASHSATETLAPQLKVGQFTVPNLASSPCPTKQRGKAATGQSAHCETPPTPKRSNTP